MAETTTKNLQLLKSRRQSRSFHFFIAAVLNVANEFVAIVEPWVAEVQQKLVSDICEEQCDSSRVLIDQPNTSSCISETTGRRKKGVLIGEHLRSRCCKRFRGPGAEIVE